MNQRVYRVTSVLLAVIMALSFLPLTAASSYAAGNGSISYTYGGAYQFDKISNPEAGSKMADGINTNDETGYSANRLNSYAWAVESRGDYVYVGTNRTLFGSALNAVAKTLATSDPNTPMTKDLLNNVIAMVTGGDVPVNLQDEDYVPQIIRFDVKNGTTKVIYQPSTKMGTDGKLYYTDMNGNIIPDADVASETASFRSVVKYQGNLYFGSLGVHMLQLVRIDGNDTADVVYQTLGLTSSLRAGCVYDDGSEEALYFGGQDTTYVKWRRAYGTSANRPLPIVIRRLDPSTAGTGQEDWSRLIADYDDFGKYAYATVYKNGGGNVWDLCSYNGKLYLILAYDGGWAMFRGEKGGAAPNSFGWTWTEIVGDNGSYPLAMDESISELNEQYAKEYGCSEYAPSLNGTGLLESTATPYVYQGKMYIGTFDNATAIQSQTVTKYLTKIRRTMNGKKGPTLKQIYAPIYEVMKHPQRVWVMDENEQITAVKEANDLLQHTTNDYVWRFKEHHGKLYTGTFDSSTAFNYFLGMSFIDFVNELTANDTNIPKENRELLDGTILKNIRTLLERVRFRKQAEADTDVNADESVQMRGADASLQAAEEDFLTASEDACDSLEEFYQGEGSVEEIIDDINNLKSSRKGIAAVETKAAWDKNFSSLIAKADALLNFFDIEGLRYWAKARALVRNDVKGFDLFVTADGKNWNRILADGINDRYNYGGRTFTICNDELYIGTANPYYGAQLWKITDLSESSAPTDKVVSLKLKAGKTIDVSKKTGDVMSWSSSNTKVATVKNGKITALKKGSATITAALANGNKMEFKVSVTSTPRIAKKSIKLIKGKTATVRIFGKAAGVKNAYKNTKYAKVTSNRMATALKIKGLKKGKTTLNIMVNGVILKLKVTVK